jgi:hypothetical protein
MVRMTKKKKDSKTILDNTIRTAKIVGNTIYYNDGIRTWNITIEAVATMFDEYAEIDKNEWWPPANIAKEIRKLKLSYRGHNEN